MKRDPIQFVIPAAGLGTRFTNVGVTSAKPNILVGNLPMICWVLGNFMYQDGDKVFVVTRKESQVPRNIAEFVNNFPCILRFIEIEKLTEGPAITVMEAEPFLDPEKPLVVMNSDQYVIGDLNPFLRTITTIAPEGSILTMRDNDKKWSFIGRNNSGEVNKIVEKEAISEEATVGIYGWSKCSLFFASLSQDIAENIRTNNEFYVAPTYNRLIKKGVKVNTYMIGNIKDHVYGLGIPDDLEDFLTLAYSEKLENTVKINLGINT
jgi:dTDP-glucose pyrophosphorylase